MKAIAINGSPKANGNTFYALTMIGEELKNQGIEFEILHVGDKAIRGCMACGKCGENKNEECILKTDVLNEYLQKLKATDAIILGSPVYYMGVAGTMKCFLDRLFYVAGANGGLFRHKVGAAVVAVRRSGGSSTFDCLNHYFGISEMLVATSNYWNIIHGRLPGEAEQDEEGKQTLRLLARNIAWMMKMKAATAETISPPEREKKIAMNFIR
jgi:multimeric flavodoxin WrbA